jgi:hypothetical protein
LRAQQRAFANQFSETLVLANLWRSAAAGLPSTEAGFATARAKFWRLINTSDDPDAVVVRAMIEAAGYELQGGTNAPLLTLSGWDRKDTRELSDRRLSIDHAAAQCHDRSGTLDPANLRFMQQRDNSARGNRYDENDQPKRKGRNQC